MDLMLLKCVAYMLLRAYANEKYLVKNRKRARYSFDELYTSGLKSPVSVPYLHYCSWCKELF